MTQEPIAYINVEKRRLEFAQPYVKWDTPTTIKLDRIPLFTQRTWVGLTVNEIALINADYPLPQGFAQAIEAKLKELNT